MAPPPWNFSKNLSVLEAPPVPKDFKRSSHLFQILQKSVNDEQYEIYKGPGSDGHVTSNLRIKALRVRLNCKMIQWKFIAFSIFFLNFRNVVSFSSKLDQDENLGTYICRAGNKLGQADTTFIVSWPCFVII